MNTDADHSCQERIMLLPVYYKPVQTIVIQNPVVNTLRCGSLVIDFFVSIRAAGDISVQTDIPFSFGFNDPSIFGSLAQWTRYALLTKEGD